MREQLEQMAIELDIYDETIFYGYMLHPEEFIPFFDIFCPSIPCGSIRIGICRGGPVLGRSGRHQCRWHCGADRA